VTATLVLIDLSQSMLAAVPVAGSQTSTYNPPIPLTAARRHP
jgi:hypothetical protein